MLTYKRSNQLEVIGYLNSSFARCLDSRESTFAYLLFLVKGVISWKSAKQSIIVSPMMEVKFMACFDLFMHYGCKTLFQD